MNTTRDPQGLIDEALYVAALREREAVAREIADAIRSEFEGEGIRTTGIAEVCAAIAEKRGSPAAFAWAVHRATADA